MKKITVSATKLCKEFERTPIIKNITLSACEGEILAILGENGAGKTTFLKLMGGLLQPTEGEALIHNQNVWCNRNEVLGHVGMLIESPYFYEHLTAKENLEIHLAYMNTTGDIDGVLQQVGLSETYQKAVSKFSMGMRQRLAIARAMIHRPDVLLLDEPINGLDPVATKEMRALFVSLKNNGATILLSSHILGEVIHTADRIAIIHRGELTHIFDVAQLKSTHGAQLEDYIITQMQGGTPS